MVRAEAILGAGGGGGRLGGAGAGGGGEVGLLAAEPFGGANSLLMVPFIVSRSCNPK